MNGAPLLLFPTRLELEEWLRQAARVAPATLQQLEGNPEFRQPRELRWGALRANVALCGCGVAAAAASAARWFSTMDCASALLVGIAGTLDTGRAPPGSAFVARRIECEGIGALEADRAVPLPFAALAREVVGLDVGSAVELAPAAAREPNPPVTLLTVCAASGTPADGDRRKRLYPNACAEDMESYGVALAAILCGVRLAVVRGISNLAGNRDHANWRTGEALANCVPVVNAWLEDRSR